MAHYKLPPKNTKKKRTFKDKVKGFFNVDIEKDLQEEECKKTFAKTKLFTLTRTNIFLGILAFMIVINILVGLDVNFLYLRQILGFLFLIFVPGLLIMLCFKIKNTGFWEYLVYTIGLSVAFIMFAGLAVNWILPWLHITDKPLSLWPILICFNIFLLALWFTAFYRNKDFKPRDFSVPKLDTLNNIFFIIPMCFPILSILGAFLLNNHGPNILTMIMLGGIAVYVLLLTIFRKRLDKNIWPWALYWMGLALLLMFTMRSWIFMGNDIVLEHNYFNISFKNSLWSIKDYSNAYNACLSVNILPSIINLFVNLNSLIVFKLIMQIVFSITPIIIYTFFNKFSKKFLSFLAGLFFTFQTGYLIDMPSHIRQEIAFIFFALMFLVLFTKNLKPVMKKTLFVIFGASMIVSHYTTSYVALALFTLTYIFILIYRIHENRKITKGKLHPSQKSEFYLTGILILLLLLFGFLWYSQVTPTANGLIDFAGKSISNFGNMFSEDVQAHGESFIDQFKIKPRVSNYNLLIDEQVGIIQNQSGSNTDIYSNTKTDNIQTHFVSSKILQSRFSYKFTSLFYTSLSFIKKIVFIFMFIGLLYLFLLSRKKKDSYLLLISLIGIISLSFLVLITIMPFGSMSYGVLRLYQQCLIVLSIFAIIGMNIIFSKISKRNKIFFTIIILFIYFFSFVGFFNQIIGGNLAFSNINNFGNAYNAEYISNTEIISISWIYKERINRELYINKIYQGILFSFGDISPVNWNVVPQLLKRNSYVYSGNTEVYNGIGFIYLPQIGETSFNFPVKFLEDNKNIIYSNGGSKIYR